MLDKNRMMIKAKVKDHIPYVSLDQDKEQGNVRNIRALMNILDDDCSTSEGESTLILDGESGDEMVKNEERANREKKKKKKRTRTCQKVKDKMSEVAVGSDIEEDDIHEVEDNDDAG